MALRFFGAGVPFGAFFLLGLDGLTSPASNTSSGRSVLAELISDFSSGSRMRQSAGKLTLACGGRSGC